MSGRLVLAATPIGNLGDISARLHDLLTEADVVYCEDTRHTAKLLNHLGIRRRLVSFHEHSDRRVLAKIQRQLREGKMLAYVSDAGMPGISDPGYELVQAAIAIGAQLDVVPGPSAVTTALMLSGLAPEPFAFMGFFPRTRRSRQQMLQRLLELRMTTVFFESPNRMPSSLDFLSQCIPSTSIAICRELTKLHQDVARGTASQIAAQWDHTKGEMVLVIAAVKEIDSEQSLDDAYRALRQRGISRGQSIKALSQRLSLSKREINSRLSQEDSSKFSSDDG